MIAPVHRRRVAVTGLGLITPIGTGKEAFWTGVRSGRQGVVPVTRFDTSQLRTRIAGEVDDFDPSDHFAPRRRSRYDRFAQFSIAAARLALEDSGLVIGEGPGAVSSERLGVAIGSALGGVSGRRGRPRRVSAKPATARSRRASRSACSPGRAPATSPSSSAPGAP